MNFITEISEFIPNNAQESQDKKVILGYIEEYPHNILLRENYAQWVQIREALQGDPDFNMLCMNMASTLGCRRLPPCPGRQYLAAKFPCILVNQLIPPCRNQRFGNYFGRTIRSCPCIHFMENS